MCTSRSINNLEWPFRVCSISWQPDGYARSSTDTTGSGQGPSSHPSGRHWSGIGPPPFCYPPALRCRGSSRGRAPCSSHGRNRPRRYPYLEIMLPARRPHVGKLRQARSLGPRGIAVGQRTRRRNAIDDARMLDCARLCLSAIRFCHRLCLHNFLCLRLNFVFLRFYSHECSQFFSNFLNKSIHHAILLAIYSWKRSRTPSKGMRWKMGSKKPSTTIFSASACGMPRDFR